MSKYDTIKEVGVAKTFDEIVEVEKFNPFHDAEGKFSNAQGFKSYSANPNTKAGAMAIARSAAAGHGSTANVHRESYGENIQQNARWMGTGKQLGRGNSGYATLRNRVERVGGLAGASRTGASWQAQNQAQGRTTGGGKQQAAQQPQQQAQAAKPTTKPTTKPKTKPKTDDQADDTQTDRKVVEGRDLIAEMGKAAVRNMTTEEVLEAQGFNAKPQIAKTESAIASAIGKHGNIAVRSWDGDDAATRAAYDDQLKNGDFYVKCSGGNALGRGMYVALSTAADKNDAWRYQKKGDIDYGEAMNQSVPYGKWHVNMVIDSSAKLITLNDAVDMAAKDGFRSDGWSSTNTVNRDIGAYAAAKGYDGIIMSGYRSKAKTGTVADNPNQKGTYVNMLNRSKVTIFESSGDNNAGDMRRSTGLVNSSGNINTTV